MLRARVELDVPGAGKFTVTEPTLGDVLASERAEQPNFALLRCCVAELHGHSDDEIGQLPARVANRLLSALSELMEPEPD